MKMLASKPQKTKTGKRAFVIARVTPSEMKLAILSEAEIDLEVTEIYWFGQEITY